MASLHEIIMYVVFLLPISTLFVNQSVSNKVLFFVSMFALVVVLLRKLSSKSFWLLLILLAEFFISLVISGSFNFYNLNDIFYLPQWVLLCLYFSQYLNSFQKATMKHAKLLRYCIYLWEILFIILRIVNPSMNEEFAHRTASSAFLIIVMVWYYARMTSCKVFNIHMIIPLAAVFILQVRTYLIVSMLVACMSYYSLFRKKIYFFLTIIPVGILTVMFILQTAIGQRFTNVTESYYGGILATITSSRSVFWAADIIAFIDSTWIHKLFGNGYNFIYDINKRVVNTYIWGHNDIIHILVTNGILGLLIYFRAFFIFAKKAVSSANTDKRLLLMSVFALAFCALFDGLYHYTCALYTIPFMFASLRARSAGGQFSNELFRRD